MSKSEPAKTVQDRARECAEEIALIATEVLWAGVGRNHWPYGVETAAYVIQSAIHNAIEEQSTRVEELERERDRLKEQVREAANELEKQEGLYRCHIKNPEALIHVILNDDYWCGVVERIMVSRGALARTEADFGGKVVVGTDDFEGFVFNHFMRLDDDARSRLARTLSERCSYGEELARLRAEVERLSTKAEEQARKDTDQ